MNKRKEKERGRGIDIWEREGETSGIGTIGMHWRGEHMARQKDGKVEGAGAVEGEEEKEGERKMRKREREREREEGGEGGDQNLVHLLSLRDGIDSPVLACACLPLSDSLLQNIDIKE